MQAIDYKKDPVYAAKEKPEIIKIPKMLFVMVDGNGAPDSGGSNETEFQKAMQIIFGIVFTIKFWDKKHIVPRGFNKFSLAPVEALWWMDDGGEFDMKRADDWRWTVMLRLPEFVTPSFFKEVVEECVKQKKSDIYRKAKLEFFEEGECVQIMHVGSYDNEGPTIKKMHDFAFSEGYKLAGKHHELYFGDSRRVTPDKLRTILRQPVKK